MYQRRNLSEEFKHQLKNGTMTNRIVITNVVVFLFIHTLAIGRMSDQDLFPLIDVIFTLNTTWKEFLMMPWGCIYKYIHTFDLSHMFFSNMIFLYFAGNMFERFFSGKKFLLVYIFGGLLGSLRNTEYHLIQLGLRSPSCYWSFRFCNGYFYCTCVL